jgi:hypothetical protein
MNTPSSIRCHWLTTATLWTLTLAGSVSSLHAQSDDNRDIDREYAIKAAYLYQFGRYVQWPATTFADSSSPLVIGVLDHPQLVDILDEIARTKRIEGRPLVIRRFASMAEYTPCNILFVPASIGPEQKAAAIQKAQRSPLLLVGEEPGFAEQGGTVNFFVEENRIRFEVNVVVAKKDQLKISSKLLTLARIVERY